MSGKKISDLDVYDDVNSDKSRRDLLEISKNTGTYGSPTYATNGSRKITIEQLKETLFIKDINSYNQVTTGSPTFDKQSYNGIANAGTYTLPTSVGSYEVLAIILEAELNVTVNGLGTGISDLVFTKQNETAYLIDTLYGWYPLAVNKEVNSSAFELLANKENTTLDTSSTKYPTNNLVKTYVDNLGNTLTSGLATKLTIANNLSDLTNTTQARDNLFLGATNDVTHNSITLSNTTVSTLPFIDSAKKLISATGAFLGTWFQTLTADTNPVDADTIVVNDSTASFEAKKTTLLQLWTNYLLAKVQALGYLSGGSLTTNYIPFWNGSNLANTTVNIDNFGGVYLDRKTVSGTTYGAGLSFKDKLNNTTIGFGNVVIPAIYARIYTGSNNTSLMNLVDTSNITLLDVRNGYTIIQGRNTFAVTLGIKRSGDSGDNCYFNFYNNRTIAIDDSGSDAVNDNLCVINLKSTTRGFGLTQIAGDLGTTRNGNIYYNSVQHITKSIHNGVVNELAVYKFDELLQVSDCLNTFNTANTGVYFPFNPKCDMNVTKIYYNLQSTGTDTVRVAIYSDSGNTPTTLLVQSSEATTGATTLGQRSITISSTRLLAGTRYWIAIKNDNGATGFLNKNDVYSNNITREGFTSGAFVGSPAPSSAVNAVWVGIGI